jgi:hypothetical protein
MIEFTVVEMQAIFSVFTDEVERLEQEDKGGWDVAQWIGFSVFQHKPPTWGKSPTKRERAAHRRRTEEMKER